MPVGLLGKKLGQTRVYDAKGIITPVTVVLAGPNRVLQCKTQQSDGYNAVQLGFHDQKEHRVAKPLLGHIKKFNGAAVKRISEFRDFSKEVKPGDVVGATLFAPGDYVDGDSTHGAKGWHRRSGAIGQRLFPGTVMRGMKMPGHLGQVRRTTQNLQVIQVREAENVLLIKGAIPGSNGDYVVIRESKKRPKGWKPHAERAENVKKADAKKK